MSLHVKSSRRKIYALAFFSACIGAIVFVSRALRGDSSEYEIGATLVFLLAAILFAFGFLAEAKKRSRTLELVEGDKDIITFDDRGIFDHRYMLKAIPWDKVAGINYGSEFFFKDVTIYLVSGEKMDAYFRPEFHYVLGNMDDFSYTFPGSDLHLTEFEMEEIRNKYLARAL